MLRMGAMAVLCAALGACEGAADPVDTSPPVVDEGSDYEPCEVLEIDPLGPNPPGVGDQWTVWLRCDGATLTGVSVLRFTPSDFATLDGNVATFLYAGTATMSLQVGSEKAEMQVEVVEAAR
jgi:hypothetical protein